MSAGRRLLFWTGAMSLALAGCGGSTGAPTLNGSATPLNHKHSQSSPIQHIVLVVQENRSFNNLFAGFPGAVSSKTGEELVKQGTGYVDQPIALKAIPLSGEKDVTHLYAAFLTGWNNGDMDGFNLIKYVISGKMEGSAPYVYVKEKDIEPYWDIAKHWGLADEMFQTQGSDSFTAHQDLIRGGTFINATESLIDPPDVSNAWGCDSAPRATTTLITTDLKVKYREGPYPCSKDFPNYGSNGYETLRDLLDAKSVSWKYYTPKWVENTPNSLWNAFDVIAPVRYGSEWKTNISSPPKNIFSDIKNGTFPAVSWVIPDGVNSDHPGYSVRDDGPSWVSSVVNAVGQSKYWSSTVVIVVWDDWGGFYDPVAPPTPRDNQGGPGFRVPMLVVSPYVQIGSGAHGGYVSNTIYCFGSILRFIEDTFNLGSLGTTDSTCTSMADMFNFSQTPRSFTKIGAPLGKAYFLRQQPSGLPVDTD